MSHFEIGKPVKQAGGYSAFIPNKFPPTDKPTFPKEIIVAHTEAIRLVGKLDGITTHLPDKNIFLYMFALKDAEQSSRIEGTNATMMDVIEKNNVEPRYDIPADVDDILHYRDALDYGLALSGELPLSLRFICELHKKLMTSARATQFAYPGEFRTSQNFIGGTRPGNATFVPPPAHQMMDALGDLEKFIHADDEYLPLIKAGLLHAQFETIHPFTDGNGRTGRMLVTMFLWQKKLLEMPVLYLSAFFNKHRSLYCDRLNDYHHGKVNEWLAFFLEGVAETANSVKATCDGIIKLRDRDKTKIQKLGKTSAESSMAVLINLYTMPIVGVADIAKWRACTPNGAYKIIERFVAMDILKPIKQGEKVYGQKWMYKDYLDLFTSD